MLPTRFVVIATIALLVSAVSGCGGGSSDRAGGTRQPKAVVLVLESHEGGAAVREWMHAVERLSHGSVRIELRDNGRRSAKETIADARAGTVDLASIPAGAFDTLGIRAFEGLFAPLLIDSYALERKVLASEVPDRMLAGVQPLGVVGTALVPGELEKILSITGPMLAPPDYRANSRQPIGIRTSELAASTFRALGTGSSSADLVRAADTFQVAGVEQSLGEIVANRLQSITEGETLASNVNFWPNVTSIVINHGARAALSAAQVDALRNAGRAALGPTMRRLAHDEHAALDVMCKLARRRGGAIAFLTASPSNLAALHTAVRPVYRQLARDPLVRNAIAAIERLKRQVEPEAAPRCPGARSPHPRAAAGALSFAGDLAATDHTTWEGPVTSSALGRGRLVLKGSHLLFRSFITGGGGGLTARFAGGELRGCVTLAITPAPHGIFRWGGPGAIASASRRLRRYVGLSLRLSGITKARELRHVHLGFASDAPSGLPC
jgi:TRAP-type C4-dicarboxylate transport system substrate-binding protein